MSHPPAGGAGTPPHEISDAAGGGPLQPVPPNVEAAASFPLYVDPLGCAVNLVPKRTDQGVDYWAELHSVILGMGDLFVTRSTTSSGWPGGGCVQYVLLAGPHKGEEIYVAEFIDPLVKAGGYYRAGHPVARFNRDHTAGVGIETGFIRPGTSEPCSTDTSGVPTPGGIAFTRWLDELGCPTLQKFGPGSTFCPCGHH